MPFILLPPDSSTRTFAVSFAGYRRDTGKTAKALPAYSKTSGAKQSHRTAHLELQRSVCSGELLHLGRQPLVNSLIQKTVVGLTVIVGPALVSVGRGRRKAHAAHEKVAHQKLSGIGEQNGYQFLASGVPVDSATKRSVPPYTRSRPSQRQP